MIDQSKILNVDPDIAATIQRIRNNTPKYPKDDGGRYKKLSGALPKHPEIITLTLSGLWIHRV
jgi:hypothetical protein